VRRALDRSEIRDPAPQRFEPFTGERRNADVRRSLRQSIALGGREEIKLIPYLEPRSGRQAHILKQRLDRDVLGFAFGARR
jgi:hypothetical protein